MLDQIIDAVRRVARAEVLPRFARVTGHRKADGSLLSAADHAAQAALVDALAAIDDVPFLGEEMASLDQETAWTNGDAGVWVVDPIDGTTNFLHGLPYYCVSVAYVAQGRPRFGVVYNPALDELFAAERGQGARCGEDRLHRVSTKTDLADAVATTDPKYLPRMLAMNVVTAPPYYSMRNWGAGALDWCWVASGRFDLMLHGGQRPWDYAAGALILEEAGGGIASFEDDDFWAAPLWRRPVIAAANPTLMHAWCAWVRTAGGFRPRVLEA